MVTVRQIQTRIDTWYDNILWGELQASQTRMFNARGVYNQCLHSHSTRPLDNEDVRPDERTRKPSEGWQENIDTFLPSTSASGWPCSVAIVNYGPRPHGYLVELSFDYQDGRAPVQTYRRIIDEGDGGHSVRWHLVEDEPT